MNEYEQIKQKIHYDKLTGIFRWRYGGQSHAGKKQPWSIAGSLHNCGYIQIGINKNRYLAHRLAWMYEYGEWPKQYIDHINGNRSDNRISNLRDVSHQTNLQNQKTKNTKNTSGFMGVDWQNKRNKWRASIKINKKSKFIGYFDKAEQAYEAYLNVKRQFHKGNTL